MAFLNIGKKDKDGKQRRIEHRGKNLRISRTGGVALRAQIKAARLNVTANSKHGLRVSTGLGKGTQVALQNGRFVLRGRYGRGPTRLNLSKSGMSVSTRNSIGTFNWVKPKRSSVKIAGVQLRGKKAANIQLFYMLFLSIALGLKLCWQLLSFILRAIGSLVTGLLNWVSNLPQLFNTLLEQRRNKAISSNLYRTKQLFAPAIEHWPQSQLRAALLLVLTGWGRGITAQEALVRIDLQRQHAATTQDTAPALEVSMDELNRVAQRLEQLSSDEHTDQLTASPQAITALLAQQLAQTLPPEVRLEVLLNADDWIVALDARTVLQEQLINVLIYFAQLRFQVTDSHSSDHYKHGNFTTPDSQDLTPLTQPTAPESPTQNTSQTGLTNLNTASLEQLQTLPHIGPDRALEMLALRPITDLAQLTTIKGIGPARLADIQQAGVVV
jgi:DNA uptake protein ComE-like DNA-binding protein